MQLFYLPELSFGQNEAVLSSTESQHLVKVLRKQVDDIVEVTNGKGDLFTCKITQANPKACLLAVVKHEHFPKQHRYYLHVLVAPTKSNERLEWFLEKATEIGIDEITPILTKNSERKRINMARYEKILLSAMKQSLQFYLPIINDLTPFSKAIQQDADQKWVAHCHEGQERKELFREITPFQKYILCIGPEGDFTPEEVQQAVEVHHYEPVSLGHTRLRTETAALVGCHLVSIKNTFSND